MRIRREDPERDVVELYPRIVWAAHIQEGHPHLRGTEVTLQKVLRILADHRSADPAALSSLAGCVLRESDIRDVHLFCADIVTHLSSMNAELARQLERMTRKRTRKPRKRKEATHESTQTLAPQPAQQQQADGSGAPPSNHDPAASRH